ncbi:MAG: DUF255 domain-containing protein [Flammeovirgaceae bacterium]|nr:DUF255 domain-containing protein [Flammeovirgaceae bacterium]MDW8286641.1 DUF255 domain-containing protein [Flammeovirgaceae bacterium]
MKKQFLLPLLIVLVAIVAMRKTTQPIALKNKKEVIEWLTFEEAVERCKKNPKKILIDVYTDWCGWCKKMDKDTYEHPTIATYINKHYYAVKFNAEQKEPVVFDNYTFKFIPQGRGGYHELAASLLQGQMSYPSTVFLDENLRLIQPLPGYYNAKDFDPILKYFIEGMPKNMSWEEYRKIYRSPF